MGGQPKKPCHRKKWQTLFCRAKLGGKLLGVLEIFRGNFGNFDVFSALIMINNWIWLNLTKLTLI